MSFAFGFAGDDIEDDDHDMLDDGVKGEALGPSSQPLLAPKMLTLSDLVSPEYTRPWHLM